MDGICPRFRFKDGKVRIFFPEFPRQKIDRKLLAFKMPYVGQQQSAFRFEKLVIFQIGRNECIRFRS